MGKLLSSLITFLMLLVAIAVFLGSSLADREGAEQRRRFEAEQHALEMQVQREQSMRAMQRNQQLEPVRVAATGMAWMGGAVGLLGAIWYALAELRKRTRLVWPNKHGVFPAIRVVLSNGTEIIHDPNRASSYATAYAPTPDGGVEVMPVMAPGIEASTRQGAAIQLTRAAVSGHGLTEDVQDVARRFLPAPANDGLPEVRVLASAAPDIEKLLEAEDGD